MKEEMRIFDGVRGGLWLHINGVGDQGEVAQARGMTKGWVG